MLKSETQTVPPIYYLSDFQECLRNTPPANFLSPSIHSSGIPFHPAFLSAVAAAWGLPHSFPSALSNNFSEVAQTLLKSHLPLDSSASNKESNISSLGNKMNLIKDDLFSNESMKRILEASQNVKKTNSEMPFKSIAKNGFTSGRDGISNSSQASNSSPISFSANSLPCLPFIAPIDSPEGSVKGASNYAKIICKYCNISFESRQECLLHETKLCSMAILKDDSSLLDGKKLNHSLDNSLNFRDPISGLSNSSSAKLHIGSSFGESDEEDSQRDSSLEEEMNINDEKKVRVRSVLSEETLRILRSQYELNPRPKKHDILRLSQEVNYPPRVVQVWFQNMRARDRRLAKTLPSIQSGSSGSSGLNSFEINSENLTMFSPNQSLNQRSLSPAKATLTIPHFKPSFNHSTSSKIMLPPPSFPASITFPSELLPDHGSSFQNLRSLLSLDAPSPAIAPTSILGGEPYKSPVTREKEVTLADSEQPLDLSIKSKNDSLEINCCDDEKEGSLKSNLKKKEKVLNLSVKMNTALACNKQNQTTNNHENTSESNFRVDSNLELDDKTQSKNVSLNQLENVCSINGIANDNLANQNGSSNKSAAR